MAYQKVMIGFTVFFASFNVTFADDVIYGLGVGVQNGVKVYLPITIGNFLLEPTLSLFERESESSDNSIRSSNEFRVAEISVGMFEIKSISSNTKTYFGVRVGYINREDAAYFSTSGFRKNKSDGYFIASTIGAQYSLTRDFSIGLDVALKYFKTEGTSKTSIDERVKIQESGYGSVAEIIMRYQFN
ncbi:MAG: hypothetical protein COB30_019435 [Ectothiorhodospiraceae bacterium]|nr:hypothetical protein [Ectothiorhodospiraceae bacterium]